MRTHEQQYRVSSWEWQPSDGHVGRRSRSAVAPAPRTRRACPRPEDRPPPVTDLVSRPSSYPCGQAGNDVP